MLSEVDRGPDDEDHRDDRRHAPRRRPRRPADRPAEPSTPSACSRWTRCRRRTRGTRARRWRWPRWATRCGRGSCGSTRAAGVGQPRPLRALAGHASTLLYALLHLGGVKSVNPDYETVGTPAGHAGRPEAVPPARLQVPRAPRVPVDLRGRVHHRPLGTGIATSVGMAIAGLWQAATFNRPGYDLFDYDVYAVAGDGCLMEGIGAEAASLAGHLKLSNLCWFYDNNRITIEGSTSLAFSEDVPARFAGLGWAVQHVKDANDLDALARRSRPSRPRRPGRPDRRRQRHRLRRPPQAGHPRRARRAARGRRGRGDQAVLPLARRPGLPRPDRVREHFSARCATTVAGCAASGRSCSPATPPSTPTSPTSSTACSAARCPTGGTPTCRSSRPTPRAGRAATQAARCSTRSRTRCRG
jgi:hypothetical protein